jgi:hypothetical protein
MGRDCHLKSSDLVIDIDGGASPIQITKATNALESSYGHGNEETPRRNDFFPSVARVATVMI